MKTKLLLIGIALAAFTTTSFAQNANENVKTTQTTTKTTNTAQTLRACFVDKDGNGLCDNFENGTCTIGNGKGLMDGTGNRQGLRDGSGAGRRDGTGNVDGVHQGRRGGRGLGIMDGTGNRNYRRSPRGRRPLNGTGYGVRR